MPVGKGLLGACRKRAGQSDRRQGPNQATDGRSLVEVKAPGIIPRQSVHEPVQTGLKAMDAADPEWAAASVNLLLGIVKPVKLPLQLIRSSIKSQ